jgi:hypothetical protein
MSPSVTHIAAPAVTLGFRVVQRCALCGAKLLDTRDTERVTPPAGDNPECLIWEAGRFVRVTEGRSVMLARADELPADNCLCLVE